MAESFPPKPRKFLRMNAVTTLDLTESFADTLRRAFKTAKHTARAAGSNVRTAKNWRAGINTPTAKHLVYLMRESDEVFYEVLRLSGRMSEAEKHEVGRKLEEIERILKR